MEGSVLNFLKAEWKVSDTGSVHWASSCNSYQYLLSTYNSQHNNNNNVVLAMTMPYSGIVIANTTLLYNCFYFKLNLKYTVPNNVAIIKTKAFLLQEKATLADLRFTNVICLEPVDFMQM